MAEYIERDAAKEYMLRSIGADPEGVCRTCIRDEHDCQYDRCWTLMDFCEKIENIGFVPAADVQPVRHGRWTKTIGENGVTSACRCNLCGFEDNRYSLFNYCPNCGAKMDGEA